MNFREYRRRETIRAAEITEESILAVPLKIAGLEGTRVLTGDDFEPFTKGQYVENRGGLLIGYTKEEFETAFAALRAPRQANGAGKGRKRAKSPALTKPE